MKVYVGVNDNLVPLKIDLKELSKLLLLFKASIVVITNRASNDIEVHMVGVAKRISLVEVKMAGVLTEEAGKHIVGGMPNLKEPIKVPIDEDPILLAIKFEQDSAKWKVGKPNEKRVVEFACSCGMAPIGMQLWFRRGNLLFILAFVKGEIFTFINLHEADKEDVEIITTLIRAITLGRMLKEKLSQGGGFYVLDKGN